MAKLLVKGQLKTSQKKYYYHCTLHGKTVCDYPNWQETCCSKRRCTHKTMSAGYQTYTLTIPDEDEMCGHYDQPRWSRYRNDAYNINTRKKGSLGLKDIVLAWCHCPAGGFDPESRYPRTDDCKHAVRVRKNVLSIMAIVGIGRTNQVAASILMMWMRDREQGPLIPEPKKPILMHYCNHIMPLGQRCPKMASAKFGNRCSIHRNIRDMFDACTVVIT